MPTPPPATRTGIPSPLGATWDDGDQAYNFALYSADATDVTLLLYGNDDAATPLATIPFEFPENKTNRVWHLRVGAAQATGAANYAYRIDGPIDPANGHRFDRTKILLDPYARCVYFPPAHSRAAACQPGPNDGRAPLARLPLRQPSAPGTASSSRSAPAPRHGHDLVIYEMHVRGFTRRSNSGLDAAIAGTYSGVVAKIPYLKALGVTAVELLPVHQVDPQEGSYWGYMTLGFFAPNGGYASVAANAVGEFRAMVDALHDAGIEVILDVVYNHTTEMGDGGPTYSFRAIDNAIYYALEPADLASYTNHSGCGNDLRTAHPAVRQLVTDSLRYWAREMNVDGFRFDLASVFLRNEDGSLNLVDPPLISEISSAPELAGIRLIAEPWSGDGSGYVMGRAFPGTSWRQWNDHFRDTVRRFVKGDAGLVGDLITRLYGSTDLFPDDRLSAYRRWQSVNYYDAHDGFNLCDLLSYTDTGQNSWNCGWQGVAGAPADVLALRQRQARNFCCLLMLANGTPMFVAGDEFLDTQQGNPNPYDQDNETTWLDWSLATTHADTLRFFRLMIGFRKAHPSIGRSAGWLDDVTWYGAEGAPDLSPAGSSVAYHLRGARVGDADLYVIANLGWEPQTFQIQAAGAWQIAVDTDAASPRDIYEPGTEPAFPTQAAVVAARSILVLIGPDPQTATN
jgi:glycogen operon protein